MGTNRPGEPGGPLGRGPRWGGFPVPVSAKRRTGLSAQTTSALETPPTAARIPPMTTPESKRLTDYAACAG
jgi:hypothetical protein